MNTTPTLSQLLEQAAVRHADMKGRPASGRRLAEIARQHDMPVTATPLTEIRSGKYKSTPSAHLLRTIAWLAGVPEAVAFAAADQPVPGLPFADDLPEGVDHLSPRSRKAAIDVLRALVQAEAGNSEQAEQAAEPPVPIDFPKPDEAVEDDPGAGQKSDDEFDLEEMLKRGAASMQRGPRQRDLIERDFPDDEGSQDPDDYK